MISSKKIIALTAVLAVLVIAVLLINFAPAIFTSDETSDKISVFETEKENITKIDVYLGYENFSFTRESDAWILTDDADKKLKASVVDELAFELASINAEQKLENPGEISQYGLDRPLAMINISYGEEGKSFVIGNKTHIGDMYYFQIMDDEDVYAISTDKVNALTKTLADYRDKAIITMTPDNIREVVVKNGNDKTVYVKDGENWTITQPTGIKADSKKIEENIVSPLSYLTVLEFVAGDDYTGHGIATEEKVVYVEDNEGNSERIVIGNRRDNGEYYIKTSSSPEIYKVEGSSLEFVELSVFDFADTSVFDISVDDLASASIKTQDAVYNLSVANGVYKVNDIEILKDKFTAMYENISSLTADSYYSGWVGGNAEITIDYTLNDGNSGKVEFISADDATYAVRLNGKAEYKLAKEKVSKVVTAVNSLIEK